MAIVADARNADHRPEDGLDIKRDRWGRPMVPRPSDPSKRMPAARPSSYVSVLEDKYNLNQWIGRTQAVGAGMRRDLGIMAAALDVKEDKKKLNEIAREMQVAGGAEGAANIGTGIHTVLEKYLLGQEFKVAPEIQKQVSAMLRLLDREGVELFDGLSETFMICEDIPAAGSPDDIVTAKGAELVIEKPAVFDLKTGGDPRDFSRPQSMAGQLSIYSRCTHSWLGEGHELVALPDIEQSSVYILWVPAESTEGHAEIIEMDADAGWADVMLAKEVRMSRRGVKKRFIRATTSPTQADPALIEVTNGGPDVGSATDEPTDAQKKARGESVRKRGIVARNHLLAALEGTRTDKAEVIGDFPAGVPNLGSDLGKHTDETMTLVERFVASVEVRLGWVDLTDDQKEHAAEVYAACNADQRTALSAWQKLEDVPNLGSPTAKLFHYEAAMKAVDEMLDKEKAAEG